MKKTPPVLLTVEIGLNIIFVMNIKLVNNIYLRVVFTKPQTALLSILNTWINLICSNKNIKNKRSTELKVISSK